MKKVLNALKGFFHEWWKHLGGACCEAPDLEYFDGIGWTAQQCRNCKDQRISHHFL